ncbi:MaoC/PaaZ C-terminal domain-containing protein [Aromatoleum toluolicum]|uniref:3-hydroxyacyl-ACP dehydratase FabZ family protein n=1 Tax=Aromatoleum toluolicum TaxID=90060 RepID=UPI00145E00C3|nr:MaoC/PaaZ C-terminal domain-containing protein [Aromatoleum toluolicum]MCQ6964005.1 MaoC/PaaZ C-terminal domain-containing protein [Aromatoleum toluolicum]
MIHESSVWIPDDHPSFAGHFPGRPILPGVVLLALATRALGEAIGRAVPPCGIASAKFLRPVGPGTELRIRLAEAGANWRFDILAGEDCVATGSLRVEPA